jgi:hypothetical protein
MQAATPTYDARTSAGQREAAALLEATDYARGDLVLVETRTPAPGQPGMTEVRRYTGVINHAFEVNGATQVTVLPRSGYAPGGSSAGIDTPTVGFNAIVLRKVTAAELAQARRDGTLWGRTNGALDSREIVTAS